MVKWHSRGPRLQTTDCQPATYRPPNSQLQDYRLQDYRTEGTNLQTVPNLHQPGGPRGAGGYILIYIHICIYVSIYIYIYICTERERERVICEEDLLSFSRLVFISTMSDHLEHYFVTS